MVRRTSLPIELIPIEDSGFHLVVCGKVNRRPVRLLVDTGASRTVLDKNGFHLLANENELLKAERHSAGLGTTEMETHSVFVETISLGGLVLKNIEVIVIDLSHVNQTYASLQLPAIHGVVGSDLLVRFDAVIDFPKKRLRFRRTS